MDDTTRSPDLVAQLRRHFVRHNVQVVSLAMLTLVTSLILWAITYVVSSWLTLLITTIIVGAQGGEVEMPRSFQKVFLAFACAFLLAAIIRRASIRNDVPTDSRGVLGHIVDIILAIPAATVAVWGNLSAWLWFNPLELSAAAGLLERITRDKRFPLHNIPVEIPDDAKREKIVFGLLMTGLLDMRRDKGVTYLQLAPSENLGENLDRILRDHEE